MSETTLISKVRELKELKSMAEELQEEITTIEDEIKGYMTEQNTDELKVDVFKVRWTKVISNRFDSTSFKKAMPELYNKFTRQIQTRRFTVA